MKQNWDKPVKKTFLDWLVTGLVMAAILAFVLSLQSCQWNLKYAADLGFMNSAQAQSYEFLVYVNGKPCKDMNGKEGLCALNIENNRKIILRHDARPYDYRFTMQCSSQIQNVLVNGELGVVPTSIDVVKAGQPLELTFLPEHYNFYYDFTCKGNVNPLDRDNTISAKWVIKIFTIDSNYQKREQIYTEESGNETAFIFGQHAKYVNICINDKCQTKKNKPVLVFKTKEIKNASIFTYSESELMRFNYYGK